MPQGGAANDPFQPAATQLGNNPGPQGGRPGPSWSSGLVVPICIQVPQTAPAGVQWGSSLIINRPFIVRGILTQVETPKFNCYCRFGSARDQVVDQASQAGGFNFVQQQSRTSFSTLPDAIALTIAGMLISPLYIPVDYGQNFLWASCDNPGITAANVTVTFLCDFTIG